MSAFPLILVAVILYNLVFFGGAMAGQVQCVPDGLAETDQTIEAVKVGAVRYAGSVAKLLG